MIPLPQFELESPRTVEEAVRLLAEAGPAAQLLAGGTDLLVNLRHGLGTPRLLVALNRVEGLGEVQRDGEGALVIGAGVTLAKLASHPLVREQAAALAEAAEKIGHPQARSAGTLGGNLCLDVRCRYIDKSAQWRHALGGCLKSGAGQCHVVKGGKQCVAALSGDTVPALVALDAQAEVVGPQGARWSKVAALRAADGTVPLTLGPAELVRAVRIPPADGRRQSAYVKWAVRLAVDFPLVSAGLCLERDGAGAVRSLKIAVGALGPRPKDVKGLERFVGERLTPALARTAADEVIRQCVPLPNIPYEPDYRRRLLGVLVRRRLEGWVE